jgi:hypothetical protein
MLLAREVTSVQLVEASIAQIKGRRMDSSYFPPELLFVPFFAAELLFVPLFLPSFGAVFFSSFQAFYFIHHCISMSTLSQLSTQS